MIAYIYRRKFKVDGRVEMRRTYRGRFRLQGDELRDVSLDTPDKQVAQSRLNELIQDRERELAGLTAPASERQAASKATLAHLTDFLADIKVLGRANEYTRHVKSRVEKLVADCGFRRLGDISPDKFVAWRGQQTGLSPKTNNEYLNSLNAFLNWLVTQNRLGANPLLKVPKVDVRGPAEEAPGVDPGGIAPADGVTTPERRLIYLTAIYTGLRLGELQKLVWADLQLDAVRPFLTARASTTKNRKEP